MVISVLAVATIMLCNKPPHDSGADDRQHLVCPLTGPCISTVREGGSLQQVQAGWAWL